MRKINIRKAQIIDAKNEYRRILKECERILAEDGAKALSDSIKKMFKSERRDDVEVVRCKDCRWKLWTHCTRFENAPVTDEDYCSKAERRTDGQT